MHASNVRNVSRLAVNVKVLAMFGLMACGFFAQAQENTSAPKTSQNVAPESSNAAATDAAWEKVVIPNTTKPAELRVFIEEISKRQPATREQYLEMQSAIKSAAETALKNQADRKSELGQFLENAFVNSSVLLMANTGQDAQIVTMNKFLEYLKQLPMPTPNDLKMALLAGQNLEQLADKSIAKKAYADLIAVLESKKGDDLSPWIEMLKGNVQRLDSVGKPLELKAKSLAGDDFDLRSTRGKHTLLYFWATWDKSTEVELPYMLEIYKKFKDLGFEIVWVSFDSDQEKVKQFITEKQVPWTVIWEAKEDWTTEMVKQYGISAIPTPMLLDGEGKVIHLEARGLILGTLLTDLLGKKPDSPQAADVKPTPASDK